MCTKFYYNRDHRGKLQSTMCVIYENGWTARGVAVCSDKDNFSRKIGRTIAYGRAVKALRDMRSSGAINYNRKCGSDILIKLPIDVASWKSVYNPYLTDLEKRLLGVECKGREVAA